MWLARKIMAAGMASAISSNIVSSGGKRQQYRSEMAAKINNQRSGAAMAIISGGNGAWHQQ